MMDFRQSSQDYARVEQAINFLEQNVQQQPTLEVVAAAVGLSEYHFQRLFTRWAGISPKRFLQFLTRENAKVLLANSSILSTTYETGLSSPGRLHDLFVHTEAVTPGEYKSHGTGVEIFYGFHPTPFGDCLLGITTRGICFLGFVDHDYTISLEQLRKKWSNASLISSPERTAPVVEKIFSPHPGTPLNIHLKGTNFQLKVWEALLCLPPGEVTTYKGIAHQIDLPGAVRAVGNAVGENPVAYLIPCHLVLRKIGEFGQYRYGSARKKAILFREIGHPVDPV
jgi:AraC family transcriptional regulator, regulatory protein of adaptative response / methylated-DNA-[protein]-cysteine methyltransferase